MAKVGTVRILYGAGTTSLQAAVHPKCALGALNMKEEEDGEGWGVLTVAHVVVMVIKLVMFLLCTV